MSLKYDPEIALDAFERKDFEEVLRLALPHAEAGNSDAQSMVALLYETGLGVNRDVLKAEVWLMKAAEQGSCLAWNNLGTLYAMGHPELKEKWDRALKCYQKAKELGFNLAEPYPPPYLFES
jgi:uncharacterized protein